MLQKRDRVVQSDVTFLRRSEQDVTVTCEEDNSSWCEANDGGKEKSQGMMHTDLENSAAGRGIYI